MPTVIARLAVGDFQGWHAEYQRMHPIRERAGDLGRRALYHDADNPGTVVVVFEWESLDRARAYFESPEVAASVQRAGGRGPPDVMYLEGPILS